MDGRKSHEITVLEEFMKENGFTRKDLEAQVGSRSRVSEVLSGKRQLSISMLKNLVNNWGIDANLLLKDPSNKPEKHAAPERKSGKDSIVWLLD
nr:helix-turn-helix domain-containing protein [Opitutae bacterium KCR 482]